MRRFPVEPKLLGGSADDNHGRVEGGAVRIHDGEEFGTEGTKLIEDKKVRRDTGPSIDVIGTVHLDKTSVFECDSEVLIVNMLDKFSRAEALDTLSSTTVNGLPDDFTGMLGFWANIVAGYIRVEERITPQAINYDFSLSPLSAALHEYLFRPIDKESLTNEGLAGVGIPSPFGIAPSVERSNDRIVKPLLVGETS